MESPVPKLLRRTLVTALILAVLGCAGLLRFDQLSSRPVELTEFSLYNKEEI